MTITTLLITDSDTPFYKKGCRYVVTHVRNDRSEIVVTCENSFKYIFKKCGGYYHANKIIATGFIEIIENNKKDKKMKEVFKVGESVYRLSFHSGVKIGVLEGGSFSNYPIVCNGYTHTEDGYLSKNLKFPSLYKLTKENYKKLCALFGEDAVPKLHLRGSDLTDELLDNQKYVIGKGSNLSDDSARSSIILEVITKSGSNGAKFESAKDFYDFVVAYDTNGNEITELPSTAV